MLDRVRHNAVDQQLCCRNVRIAEHNELITVFVAASDAAPMNAFLTDKMQSRTVDKLEYQM